MFDLKIGAESQRRQIRDYVKCIETHYTDIIARMKVRAKKAEVEAGKKLANVVNQKDKRSQLEEILIDAIDKTRL